jgi:hypothetical protein
MHLIVEMNMRLVVYFVMNMAKNMLVQELVVMKIVVPDQHCFINLEGLLRSVIKIGVLLLKKIKIEFFVFS